MRWKEETKNLDRHLYKLNAAPPHAKTANSRDDIENSVFNRNNFLKSWLILISILRKFSKNCFQQNALFYRHQGCNIRPVLANKTIMKDSD